MSRVDTRTSDRLLEVVAPYENVVIVMHDNPDPDAIAAGWALHRMLAERVGIVARLVGGGDIVRAENREMVRVLRPPLELVDHLDLQGEVGVILVDCGAGAANHLLSGAGLRLLAVVDHHQTEFGDGGADFCDIRPRVAAAATIAASYLKEQHFDPQPPLATALLYGIRTETRHAESHFSKLDRSMLAWLTALCDPAALAAIENAPLSRAYFSDFVLALQNTFVYDDAALCFLPRAEGAEIIGEVSDLLVRCEEIRRVLCAAVIGEDVLVSVRTDRKSGNAATLVQATLQGLGHGGGHLHRAGGKISNAADAASLNHLLDELRGRWLSACGVQRQRGTRLVAKREIVENL